MKLDAPDRRLQGIYVEDQERKDGERLDLPLWKPTALGLIGPTGFLRTYLSGRDTLIYRPLELGHLSEPSLTQSERTQLRVAGGRKAVKRLIRAGRVDRDTLPKLGSLGRRVPDRQWVGVSIHGHDRALLLAVARPWPEDPRIAEMFYFWSDQRFPIKGSLRKGPLVLLWRVLTHELARAGFLGLVADYADPRIKLAATHHGSFKSVATALSEFAATPFPSQSKP
jgi:hypothetical protein